MKENSKPEGISMSNEKVIDLANNAKIMTEGMKALAHGPYSRLREMHRMLNPEELLEELASEPWLAC